MSVTIKDIALRAGVSKMAVSAVVNHTKSTRVSQEKRVHISRVAEEMGYVPNLTAQVLSGKSSRTIGIFNLHVSQYSIAVLAAQFLRKAAQLQYQLLIDSAYQRNADTQLRHVMKILRRSPDGVIFLGIPPPSIMEMIKIPNVIIPHYSLFSDNSGDLYCDLTSGGYMAGLHFLAHRHQKVAYVCTRLQNPVHDKFNGLQLAWCEAGLPQENLALVESWYVEGSVEDRLLHLIKEEGYTGALMSNDFVAARALLFLRDKGIRVPEDFAIISYDADAFAYLTDPPLSTISQSYDELVTKAMELLLERIDKKLTGDAIIRLNQLVKPAFFKGGSCGCPCEHPPILGWSPDMMFLEESFPDRIVTYDDFVKQHKEGTAVTSA